jgi:hypothetical protein
VQIKRPKRLALKRIAKKLAAIKTKNVLMDHARSLKPSLAVQMIAARKNLKS